MTNFTLEERKMIFLAAGSFMLNGLEKHLLEEMVQERISKKEVDELGKLAGMFTSTAVPAENTIPMLFQAILKFGREIRDDAPQK